MLSINLSSGTPERSLIICMFTLPNINLPKGELSILNFWQTTFECWVLLQQIL